MKVTVIALALLWAGALFAQTPPSPAEHAAHLEKLATLLDLTDAQKPQVQAILQEEHAKMRQMMQEAKASGTKPDFETMRALHQQIKGETVQKLSPVLSAAQLKKFQALSEMHGMHGHFGHGGPADGATPPKQN
jgi:hypothetical protein